MRTVAIDSLAYGAVCDANGRGGNTPCIPFLPNWPTIDRMVLSDFVLGPGVIRSLLPRASCEGLVSKKNSLLRLFLEFLALISPSNKNSLSLNYLYEQHPLKTRGNCNVETASTRKV